MRWMGSKRRCRSTGPPRPERVRAAQGCFAAGERIRLYKLMRDLSLNDMVLAGGEGRELLAAIRDEALNPLRARQGRERR